MSINDITFFESHLINMLIKNKICPVGWKVPTSEGFIDVFHGHCGNTENCRISSELYLTCFECHYYAGMLRQECGEDSAAMLRRRMDKLILR